MPWFKNVSAEGDRELPLIRRVIERGEVFELTDEQAVHIAGQVDNFAPVDAPKPTLKKAAD